MKWSNEAIEQLKVLANKGTSNKNIAFLLNISLVDVYAKRSQLGITIGKVKGSAGIINPEFEVALPKRKKALPKVVKEYKNKNGLFFWVLDQLLKIADESIKSVELTSAGKTVTISYKSGGVRIANIECDSDLAIIADVVRVCLK